VEETTELMVDRKQKKENRKGPGLLLPNRSTSYFSSPLKNSIYSGIIQGVNPFRVLRIQSLFQIPSGEHIGDISYSKHNTCNRNLSFSKHFHLYILVI
jgi:hypothetical protein